MNNLACVVRIGGEALSMVKKDRAPVAQKPAARPACHLATKVYHGPPRRCPVDHRASLNAV